jgi:hypothetical protein
MLFDVTVWYKGAAGRKRDQAEDRLGDGFMATAIIIHGAMFNGEGGMSLAFLSVVSGRLVCLQKICRLQFGNQPDLSKCL